MIENGPIAGAAPPEPHEIDVGRSLRQGREKRSLSVEEVARSLKLSPHQVQALEANDWQKLSCATIVRGFVRNYARLLAIEPEALMRALDAENLPRRPELAMTSGTQIDMTREEQAERKDYARVFAGVAILALAVFAYTFVPQDFWQTSLASVKSLINSNEPAAANAPPPAEEEKKDDPAFVPLAVPEPAPVPEPPPPVAEPSPPPAAQNAASTLYFSFERPSWVQVRDRTGEVVFSQLNQPGTKREVKGALPMTATIGNASGVTLTYMGKPVDLSKRSKDDVARVTVE